MTLITPQSMHLHNCEEQVLIQVLVSKYVQKTKSISARLLFLWCWSKDSIHVFDFCLIHQPSFEYSSWKSTGQHLGHCFTKGNIDFRHPGGQAVYQPNCRLVLICFLSVPTLPKFDSEGLRKGGSTSTCVILHSIYAS